MSGTKNSRKPAAAGISPAVAQAVEFTETYKRYRNEPAPIREAMCLKTQFPAMLNGIRKGDLLAGRRPTDIITYFGTIWWSAYPSWRSGTREEGKQGGYCFNFASPEKMARTEEEKKILSGLADFWETECSPAKARRLWDAEMRETILGTGQVVGSSVGFCVALDLDKLLQRGIPGLIKDVEARMRCADRRADGADPAFLKGLRMALDVFLDVCRHYEKEALALAEDAATAAERRQYDEMAHTLAAIAERPPQTFREALQLMWLYTMLASGKHMEGWRLDTALGDFYARDLDRGVILEEEAMDLLLSLWTLYNENGEAAVCRIVIGGRGRRNEANADRFALAAMEATRRHRKVTPQLTLRFYAGQDPRLLQRAYDVIAETGVYPMLYNDDAVIPGIVRLLDVSPEEAASYHPLGCGEYMLAARSPSLLDSVWSIPKSLEAVLHNGRNTDGVRIGPETGTLDAFDTFEKLEAAFRKQTEFAASLLARSYKSICDGYAHDCSFLLASLLTDDCVERGRGMFDGGVRYLGACGMGHGFTNAADALTAIRKLVYREKRVTLAELVAALDANFEGRAPLRKMLLAAPKFGNDQDEADRTLADMWRHINAAAKDAGARAGLRFLTISSVNPGGYGMGSVCGATADGRCKGEPFAIGNAPTAGFDTSGITAMFNSVAKVDPANGGATTNVKISREFFTGSRAKTEALFGAYFARGGMQANVTVVSRGDLEAALRTPEKYSHVLVRLGGWSARFIDLEPAIQQEILRRTLY